jgi:signal transduction histidine kinase
LEAQFIELEDQWLNTEYFTGILMGNSPGMGDGLKTSDANPGNFLLDQDFEIVFPKIAEERNHQLITNQRSWNFDYRLHMGRAETEEFARRNYTNAARNYRKSLGLAETKQQEALAIEGMARSYLAGQNYPQAIGYYQRLKNDYSQTVNLGGHPYGISAPLQLYAIGALSGDEIFGNDSLLTSYQLMKEGHWLISSSSYFFFKAEYESILEIEIESRDSRFEGILKFNQFLDGYAIPAIKERSGFSEFDRALETKRAYVLTDDAQYLVSFKEMLIPENDKLYIGGIRWNLDSVTDRIIPNLLADLEEETGLDLLLLDDNYTNLLNGEPTQIPEESLSLTFSTIPFPWTLVAIQPGYEKLESDVKIQLIIYGLLIAIIIALMFFGVFILLRDISRETDSMLLQTEFVHNVSHELKTPLSLIRLYGETLLLKEHLPEADRKEGLQIITKESERLSYMINNILDFSKIEMGRKEFDLKPGKLAEVVRNTLDSYRYHFVKKGFIVEEDIDQDIPEVLFDKDAVEGILINLFSNAIKFSDSTRKMVVNLLNTNGAICLRVADQGIGIPPNEVPNIFNRFYRVKSTSDFEARGSGLGLTLVKHAVDAHGWRIEVESTPGQGSVFSIFIPLKANEGS